MPGKAGLFEQVVLLRDQYVALQREDWYQHLFSYQWWLLVSATIAVSIVWCKLVNKKQISETLILGMFIAILSSIFDMLGRNYQSWKYAISIHWAMSAPTLPFDMILIPFGYMLCYQYTSNWKSFSIITVIISAVNSFGSETIFRWLGIYKPLTWQPIYSLPIYISMALLGRWMVKNIIAIEKQSQIAFNIEKEK